MSRQNIEPPLQPFRTAQFSSPGTPAGSHGEVTQEGSARGAAPAGVRQDWGVIGLSQRLASFPMRATAVGRPRGTIWNSVMPSSPRQAFSARAIESGRREAGTQSCSSDVSQLLFFRVSERRLKTQSHFWLMQGFVSILMNVFFPYRNDKGVKVLSKVAHGLKGILSNQNKPGYSVC